MVGGDDDPRAFIDRFEQATDHLVDEADLSVVPGESPGNAGRRGAEDHRDHEATHDERFGAGESLSGLRRHVPIDGEAPHRVQRA